MYLSIHFYYTNILQVEDNQNILVGVAIGVVVLMVS